MMKSKQMSRVSAITDTVSQRETGGGCNRVGLVSQLSMFRRKFADLPQLDIFWIPAH